MLIVDSQSDTVFGAWADPLVDVHTEQFKSTLTQMRALTPATHPEQLEEAYELARRQCDASRQIVYRLHRVTRQQLSALCNVFDQAIDCINQWQIATDAGERQRLILDFSRHISDRSTRLLKRLENS